MSEKTFDHKDNDEVLFLNEKNQSQESNVESSDFSQQHKNKRRRIEDSDSHECLLKLKNELNQEYWNKVDQLKNLYIGSNDSEAIDWAKVIQKPYRIMQLKNFIPNENVLKQLYELVTSIRLLEKSSDLYSFRQSLDLLSYQKCLPIVEFFRTQVKFLLEKLTGLRLNDEVDLTISKYEQNDFLLCHDDQLNDRKIAFIYYLVDERWSNEEDSGGQLDLFSLIPETNVIEPYEVVESLLPCWNSFVFFEVSPVTFHQVREVISTQWSRWSINGWFHQFDSQSPSKGNIQLEYPRLSIWEPPPSVFQESAFSKSSVDYLKEWIHGDYFLKSTCRSVRQHFGANSEIQLKGFLLYEKFRKLETALKQLDQEGFWTAWSRPLFGRFDYIDHNNHDAFKKLPSIIQEFYLFLNSEPFFLFITRMVGVVDLSSKKKVKTSEKSDIECNNDSENGTTSETTNLENVEPDNVESARPTPKIGRSVIRRWRHGHYTLSNDINPELSERALDLTLFFNVQTKPIDVIEISDSEDDNSDQKSKTSTENNRKLLVEKINLKSLYEKKKNSSLNEEVDDEKTSQVKSQSDSKDDEVIYLSEEEEENDKDDEVIGNDNDDEESLNDDEEDSIEKIGGNVTYVEIENEEPILTIEPMNNFLNVVYRAYRVQRFMSYLTQRNTQAPFHEISISFENDRVV